VLRSVKGLKDILPPQTPQWRHMETVAHRLAIQSGFSEIRLPIFEFTELFARSIGGATDIVEKEMYTFLDRDGSSLTLRPEGTAGVVRAVLEHHLLDSLSTRKLYYLGPMFRHERPQAGRYRQFHQFGVEAFGTDDPSMDVEIIALLWRYFRELGLKNLTLHLNSIGNLQDRERYVQVFKQFLAPNLETLCGNCQRRFSTNPLRILDCKVPICQETTQNAPVLFHHLSPESASHFQQVLDELFRIEIPYTLNYRLVRGLDYYSRTTFEITSPQLGAQSTLGAGGRYDGLVELLHGPPTPAIGFAVGLERVALLLQDFFFPSQPPLFFMAGFGKEAKPIAYKLLHNLREIGIRADTDYKSGSLKSLLRSADKLGASYAIILGDDEVHSHTAIIRNMTTKSQESVKLEEICQRIQSLHLEKAL
jgi:histidyl-tRNA synthetase